MAELTRDQNHILECLRDLKKSGQATPPSCFVYGPPGSGKRTVVSAFAKSIGLKFLEVNVGDVATSVQQRLFGTRAEAELAASLACAPGDCGGDEAALLYLSGLENLHPSLHQIIHRLITNRCYVDAIGCRWSLSDNLWLFGSIRTTGQSTHAGLLGLEDWLCTSFRHSIQIDICRHEEAIWEVCRCIAKEFGRKLDTKMDPTFFRIIRSTPGRLHAVKRWIMNATFSEHASDVIPIEDLKRQMLNDIRAVLAQLPYRGRTIKVEEFERWAGQFSDWKMIAYEITRQIADLYYIGPKEYHSGLNHIIRRFEIPKRSIVTFCKWQVEGKSASRVASQMKTQAHWKALRDHQIDLTQTPPSFSGLDLQKEHQLVLVDDFVGSGRTLGTLFAGQNAPIPMLLRTLPNARLFIGIIAGYRDALQKLLECTLSFGDRIKLVPYRVFDEKDRCFSDDSRILPNPDEREGFRRFSIKVADQYFPGLKGRHRVGFNGVASLVVFSDTVPNNSLPLLWYDNSNWVPLFPASGLPLSEDL